MNGLFRIAAISCTETEIHYTSVVQNVQKSTQNTEKLKERHKIKAQTYRVGQKSDTSRTYITLYERYHFFGPIRYNTES